MAEEKQSYFGIACVILVIVLILGFFIVRDFMRAVNGDEDVEPKSFKTVIADVRELWNEDGKSNDKPNEVESKKENKQKQAEPKTVDTSNLTEAYIKLPNGNLIRVDVKKWVYDDTLLQITDTYGRVHITSPVNCYIVYNLPNDKKE